MVSVVCMTRGVEQQFEQWKKFMGSQMFPWNPLNLKVCTCGHPAEAHNDTDGCTTKLNEKKICSCMKFTPRREMQRVAGTLRPIQLFEYVIPEEVIPVFLAMQGDLWKSFVHGQKLRKEITAPAWVLRKMMGLKPMPTYSQEEFNKILLNDYHFVPMAGMAVYPIGIKVDNKGPIDFGKEGKFDQEWL